VKLSWNESQNAHKNWFMSLLVWNSRQSTYVGLQSAEFDLQTTANSWNCHNILTCIQRRDEIFETALQKLAYVKLWRVTPTKIFSFSPSKCHTCTWCIFLQIHLNVTGKSLQEPLFLSNGNNPKDSNFVLGKFKGKKSKQQLRKSKTQTYRNNHNHQKTQMKNQEMNYLRLAGLAKRGKGGSKIRRRRRGVRGGRNDVKKSKPVTLVGDMGQSPHHGMLRSRSFIHNHHHSLFSHHPSIAIALVIAPIHAHPVHMFPTSSIVVWPTSIWPPPWRGFPPFFRTQLPQDRSWSGHLQMAAKR